MGELVTLMSFSDAAYFSGRSFHSQSRLCIIAHLVLLLLGSYGSQYEGFHSYHVPFTQFWQILCGSVVIFGLGLLALFPLPLVNFWQACFLHKEDLFSREERFGPHAHQPLHRICSHRLCKESQIRICSSPDGLPLETLGFFYARLCLAVSLAVSETAG